MTVLELSVALTVHRLDEAMRLYADAIGGPSSGRGSTATFG